MERRAYQRSALDKFSPETGRCRSDRDWTARPAGLARTRLGPPFSLRYTFGSYAGDSACLLMKPDLANLAILAIWAATDLRLRFMASRRSLRAQSNLANP